MDTYITAAVVRQLREKKGITQAELADALAVSSKTISKWETGRGLPDISLLQPLAQALGVSVIELINGRQIENRNRGGNLLRSKIYVCPVCGNAVFAAGDALVSCCGIVLPALEAEETDAEHGVTIENVEDEYFITIDHPMTKEHYISFMAFVTGDRLQMVKLYPEGNAQTRFQRRGRGMLYFHCKRHGLFKMKL